jgi:hypothetical protein
VKPAFLLSLFLIVLSILGFIYNIFAGFDLTKSADLSPDNHLVLGLLSYGFSIIAQMGAIFFSSKLLFDKNKSHVLSSGGESDSPLQILSAERQFAVWHSLVVIVLGLVSVITGTISHAGRQPLIHIVFGFLLVIFSAHTFVKWSAFMKKL